MKPKKNPKIEVGRNSSLYFAIGLIVMLSLTYISLEYKTRNTLDKTVDTLVIEKEIDNDIPIKNLNILPPPPPPPVARAPEIIKVVENIVEIEETIFESTETDQDEKIVEYEVVAVEDVEVEEIEEDIIVPFSVVEKVPVFPGCTGTNIELKACFKKMIMQHIVKNFNYPEIAISTQQQGKVHVLFYIDKQGNVSNMRSRGPYKALEQEAERIISSLPRMQPAMQRNNPVKIPYSVPIVFKLESY